MINTKELIKTIKKDDLGLSLSELVIKTKFSRGQIRIAIAYLLGSEQIKERKFGMNKLYYINENGK